MRQLFILSWKKVEGGGGITFTDRREKIVVYISAFHSQLDGIRMEEKRKEKDEKLRQLDFGMEIMISCIRREEGKKFREKRSIPRGKEAREKVHLKNHSNWME